MIDSPGPTIQFYRVDPLTTCHNLLAFIEWLTEYSALEPLPPVSLMFLDMKSFDKLNDERGHLYGDIVLRDIGLALQDETHLPVYRIGGDEFVVVLPRGSVLEREALARQMFQRISREADRFSLSTPVARVALVHYSTSERIAPSNVILQLSLAMVITRRHEEISFQEFAAADLVDINDPEALRWVAERAVNRMVALGMMLDDAHRLAMTDPITGLPNSRAAQHKLKQVLAHASLVGQSVSILMMDGDNLKAYNANGYAAGDEMIRMLGSTLLSKLRPGDFLARWRMGDEFLVILPGSTREQATLVAERLLLAVQQTSQAWPLPVTISAGVAAYPQDYTTAEDLLARAEEAQRRAKAAGKNRVVMAG